MYDTLKPGVERYDVIYKKTKTQTSRRNIYSWPPTVSLLNLFAMTPYFCFPSFADLSHYPNSWTNSEWNLTRSCSQVIDLDPYGSVAPFIDAAVQSIRSGGNV